MDAFRFHVPTEIRMGAGALDTLGETVAPFGSRPFLVTGKNSARQSGALDAIRRAYPDIVHYDGVEENPTTEQCEAAAERCRDASCDCIVAAGGGSPIDVAKAVAVLAANGGRCAEYFGAASFHHSPLPLVAIPTTAGAGSEVTPYAVLVDSARQTKRTIGHRSLFPRAALLDPGLTVTMPRDVTLATGLDALSQAMEGMVSQQSTPLGDVLAVDAIERIRRWLPEAIRNPEHGEARSQMQFAAMLSGCVIAQSGTTLVHGMGYHLTLRFGIAHGIANALLLPPAFEVNARECPDAVERIAQALGAPAGDVSSGLETFYGELGLRRDAAAWGVRPEELEACAARVWSEPGRFRNQRGTFDESKVLDLYWGAFSLP